MKFVLIILILAINICSAFGDLKNPEAASDYLIIYHEEFKNDISEFAEWRKSKGLKVLTVNLSEIINEFSDNGQKDTTQSILAYTNYIINNWKSPKLRYLLLVGSINHIPSVKIESYFHDNIDVGEDSVHSDLLYASTSEKITKFSVGRFPARNIQDLKNITSKTYLYEDNFLNMNYKSDVVFLTDVEDSSSFKSAVKITNNIYPNQNRCKTINFTKEKPLSEFHKDIEHELSDGTAMFGYYGHGSPKVLSRSSIINVAYLDTLYLPSNPFIFYSIGCSLSFDDPLGKSLTEYLVTMENQGAVATITSSGVNFADDSGNFIFSFIEGLLNFNEFGIGDAQIYSCEKRDFSYWTILFNILGDPALKIPFSIIASTYENQNQDFSINIFPNPAAEYLNVDLSVLTGSSDITVCDLKGNKLIQKSAVQNSPISLNINELSSGNYFIIIKSGEKLFVKSFVKL